MKYIFFGTPQFAAFVLEKLISVNLTPLAVVTNPDRPIGRRHLITPPPVKQFVQKFPRIDVIQPEKFDASFAQQIESRNADCFVVAAYGKILPHWLITMPPRQTIGLHPSLLPLYRGPTPIQSAILDGIPETGVTVFLLTEKVDSGPILASQKIKIGNQNYNTLNNRLAKAGGELLVKVLPNYLAEKIAPHPQDERRAIFTHKFTSTDSFVPFADLQKAAEGKAKGLAVLLWRKIRALNPEPGVFTTNPVKQRIKLLAADLKKERLVLQEIQPAGKKPQKIKGAVPINWLPLNVK